MDGLMKKANRLKQKIGRYVFAKFKLDISVKAIQEYSELFLMEY